MEPELGTPARGGVPATRAVPAADGFRVSGRKVFSTGSYGLKWMVVWAATPEDDPDGQRTGPFLVPADAAGITIVETWDHLGMRASASHDVVFEDTPIPREHAAGLLPAGTLDNGLRSAHVLGWMIVLVLSVYDGVAQAARDWLVGYLNERTPTNLGAPLASLPRFQAAVGEIDALLHANERAAGLARQPTSTPAARRPSAPGGPRAWRRSSSRATSSPWPSRPSRSSATPASPVTTRCSVTCATRCAAASTARRTTRS